MFIPTTTAEFLLQGTGTAGVSSQGTAGLLAKNSRRFWPGTAEFLSNMKSYNKFLLSGAVGNLLRYYFVLETSN